MDKAFQFLKDHKDVAFATVDDGKPQIRVFQVMYIDGDTVYFATSPHKKVYAQLLQNPNVEILGLNDNISVRMSGKVTFDVADAIRRKIFDDNPVLPRLYSKYTDLVYVGLKVEELDWFDLNTTPPEQIHKSYGQD